MVKKCKEIGTQSMMGDSRKGVIDSSLPELIYKLVDLNSLRVESSFIYGEEPVLQGIKRKRLKLKIYNALFSKNLAAKYGGHSLSWQKLSRDGWETKSVAEALAFRMKFTHRRYLEADTLTKKVDQVLEIGDDKYENMVQVLFHLANVNKPNHEFSSRQFLPREDRERLSKVKGQILFGELPNYIHTNSYPIYPSWVFDCNVNRPLMHSSLSLNPEPQHYNAHEILNLMKYKEGDLLGFHSNIFRMKNLSEDIETNKEVTETLYSGLAHSKIYSLNDTISIPPLRNKPIDLMQGLLLKRCYQEEDEGFVSPGCENSSTNDQGSEDELGDDSGLGYMLENDQPYIGYRKPDYDISVWRKCLDQKRSKHRTWETWGQFAGVTKKQYYLSEAGDAVFDFVWKERQEIIYNLARNLSRRAKAIAPVKQEFIRVDQEVLTHHSHLVIVGIPSDTYAYNSLARMFIASKNVYFSGVTACSTRSLLIEFAEYGTCYLRLVKFSTAGLSQYIESNQHKGVIFKAFCDGIKQYLCGYQQNALEQGRGQSTLGKLQLKFQQAGPQIRYLAKLCGCADPDTPMSSTAAQNFPTGISLLTYLYEEALYSSQSNDYPVLLYLLKKCCEPYLQFVQKWVFHGMCWEYTDEFMLKMNDENFARKDRRRWTNYIVSTHPENIKSTVPSFLAPIVSDIFICGKSRNLLQQIDPEHFLCTGMTDFPELLLTFSKTKMKQLSNEWKSFETSMLELEKERITDWEVKEEEITEKKRKLAQKARKLFEHQLRESQEEENRIKQEIWKLKQTELTRLHDQVLEDIERKKLHRQQEIEEDRMRQEKFQEFEQKKLDKENEILQEAKQEMISHYQKLTKKAERRKMKADWLVKRHKLDERRIKFLHSNHNQIPTTGDAPIAETKLNLAENIECIQPQNQPPTFDAMLIDFSNPTPVKEIPEVLNPVQPEVEEVLEIIRSTETGNVQQFQHVPQDSISSILYNNIPSSTVASSVNQAMSADHVDTQASFSSKKHVSEETSQSLQPKSSIYLSTESHVSDQTKQDEFSDYKHSPGTPHATDQIKEKPLLIKQVQSGQSHVFDQSKPVEVHFWKIPKNKPHISQQTAQIEQMLAQSDENRPHANKQSTEIAMKRASTVQVDGKHVSHSTIFDHVYEASDKTESIIGKRPKKSDFESIKQQEPNDLAPSNVARIVVDKNSENIEAKGLPQRYEQKVTNITSLPHTSDSTIQDLMYISPPEKPEKSKTNYIPGRIKEEVSSHPSQSSIQLLMYPSPTRENFLIQNDNVKELEMKKFEAEILENDNYHAYIQDISPDIQPNALTNGIDLFKSITRNVIVENDELENGLNRDDLVAIDLHALPVLLRNCVIRPIRAHAAFVNRCMINYFMVDLKLPRHFEMLRHFLLFEDGEFAQTFSNSLFEMIHSGSKPTELLNPMNLDSIISQAIWSSALRDSNLTSNLTISVKYLPPAFSPSDLYVLNCIKLKYHAEFPCNIILTESCHTKYNHVFAFLMQLKHVVWALHDIRARLTRIGTGTSNITTMSNARKLQIFRHEMHNFVRVMQGYVSTQVSHVCWQEFNEAIRTQVFTLDDLHLKHAEYVNKCVLRCLLTPKAQSIMNVICDALRCILRFRTHLSMPSSCSFEKLESSYQEFVKYSNFLHRVVSRLVEKGYQPHLEDFLIRLNFNNYYKLSSNQNATK